MAGERIAGEGGVQRLASMGPGPGACASGVALGPPHDRSCGARPEPLACDHETFSDRDPQVGRTDVHLLHKPDDEAEIDENRNSEEGSYQIGGIAGNWGRHDWQRNEHGHTKRGSGLKLKAKRPSGGGMFDVAGERADVG